MRMPKVCTLWFSLEKVSKKGNRMGEITLTMITIFIETTLIPKIFIFKLVENIKTQHHSTTVYPDET